MNALCNSCEDMECRSSVQCTVYYCKWNSCISETVRNRTHAHIHFLVCRHTGGRLTSSVLTRPRHFKNRVIKHTGIGYHSWDFAGTRIALWCPNKEELGHRRNVMLLLLYIRGLTIKFTNSPQCACRGSSGNLSRVWWRWHTKFTIWKY
jgi:hypothetical protein